MKHSVKKTLTVLLTSLALTLSAIGALPMQTAKAAAAQPASLSAGDWAQVRAFLPATSPDTQQAYLKASNTDVDDTFGYAVSLSGNILAVGAYAEDSNTGGVNGNQADNSASNAGAVYIFTRSGSTWSQQAYLKASNTGAGDLFGYAVSLDDNTLVVGAHREDSIATGVNGNQGDNSAESSGAAYVFTRSGGVWSQQAYLKASNTQAGDVFGIAVSVDGDTLVVGAHQADTSATESGQAYVFTRSAGVWSQQAYLKASNSEAGDNFGFAVSLSGETLVVGAYSEDSNAGGVDGNQADNSASNSGAAYVFTRSGSTWSQQAYLKASNTGVDDIFGYTLSLSGDTLVIGADGEDSNASGVNGNQGDNSAVNSGAAYVFTRSGSTWSQQAYLKASNTEANDYFGYAVSLSGDTLVVTAHVEDSSASGVNGNQMNNLAPDSGAAYVFTRIAGVWSQQAYLKASNTGAVDQFGSAVSISGDTLLVGASHEDSSATGVNGNQASNSAGASGAAYVFNVTAPSVVSSAWANANPSNLSSLDFSVSFSEPVTGVDATDFVLSTTGVSGATISGVSGSGSSYTVSVSTGSGNGSIRLDLADDDSIIDATSNPLGGDGTGNGDFTGGESYTIDKTAPSVLSSVRANPSPTGAASANFAVTFSEPVTDVDMSDFSLDTSGVSGASVSVVSGSGVTRTVSVNTGSGNGSIRLDVPNTATISDTAGNALAGLPFTTGETYATDKSAPTVVSIMRASGNPTNAISIDYTVTFSKSVTGVNAGDFSVSVIDLSGASVFGVSGSGTTYTVTVATGSGSGLLRLDVIDNDSIVDLVSNPLGGAGLVNGDFTTGETYSVDKSAPETQIDSQPASLSASTSAIFDFSSTDGTASFECSLNGGAYVACTSPKSYTSLAEGPRTFSVHAKDPAGNVDATPASYNWTIDTTAPSVSINAQPANPSASADASFTFSSTDGTATFTCDLDGAGFSACSSPKSYLGLVNGSHTFSVKATDSVGNTGAPASYAWMVYVPFERALNGGFNIYAGKSKIPTNWVKNSSFAATDGKDTKAKKEGTASVKIAGAPGKTKTLTQTLMLSGLAGDAFTFSFWARGTAIPAVGVCQAQVMLYDGAVLKLTKKLPCKTGTYAAFQKKTLTFNATSAYTKVVIKFTSSKASGTVWLDAVSLIK